MDRIEAVRGFDLGLEEKRIRKGEGLGATEEEIWSWSRAQIERLLIEHGPVHSVRAALRQKPYVLEFHQNSDGVSAYATNELKQSLTPLYTFGDQQKSFEVVEENFPSVQQGMQRGLEILVQEEARVGDGFFWISPMEFYLHPRTEADKPSTYDVINYQVISDIRYESDELGNQIKIISVVCQTVNIRDGLSKYQRRKLMEWHDTHGQLDGGLTFSADEVVSNPIRITIGDDALDDYFRLVNQWSLADSSFGYPVTGMDETWIFRKVSEAVNRHLSTLIANIRVGNYGGVNWLITRINREIKDIDSIRLGIDPETEWQYYLSRMSYMVHPLTGEGIVEYLDPLTGQWLGGDNCGPEDSAELKRCLKHGEYSGKECSKCKKMINESRKN